MSSFGLYRLGATVFTFAGIRVEDGVVSVKVEPFEDDFTEEQGSNGMTERAATENDCYKVTLELKAAANYNQVLSRIRSTDVSTDGGAGVAPMAIEDPNGASLFGAEIAYIKRPADLVHAKERGNVSWIFTAKTPAGAYVVGGNQL